MKKVALYKPNIDNEDINAVSNAVASTFVSGDGPECRLFEKELAEYLGVKYVFFVTNCTAALDLAFMVKDFPAGSEVIVPNFTFTSTALAPILNNLKVRLVDVDPVTGNINIGRIEENINEKTVAIVPIDYAGLPLDMDSINKIAKKHNLYVVQDSAQSIGAEYKGKKTGNFADVTCFSFHGTKNLVCGEGGAIVTNDDEIAQKILIMRDKGTDKHTFLSDPLKKGYYEYVDKGNSYVQSNIIAALGRTQLKKLDRLNKRRSDIANIYNRNLSKIERIKIRPDYKDIESNWHIYYILVEADVKMKFIEEMNQRGVNVNVHYNPLHINSYYNRVCEFDRYKLSNSVSFYNSLVRIPMYPDLTDDDAKYVCETIKTVINEI